MFWDVIKNNFFILSFNKIFIICFWTEPDSETLASDTLNQLAMRIQSKIVMGQNPLGDVEGEDLWNRGV